MHLSPSWIIYLRKQTDPKENTSHSSLTKVQISAPNKNRYIFVAYCKQRSIFAQHLSIWIRFSMSRLRVSIKSETKILYSIRIFKSSAHSYFRRRSNIRNHIKFPNKCSFTISAMTYKFRFIVIPALPNAQLRLCYANNTRQKLIYLTISVLGFESFTFTISALNNSPSMLIAFQFIIYINRSNSIEMLEISSVMLVII